MRQLPKARTEGVIAERVDDELLVYDEVSQTAHCLAVGAASVWQRCDGRLTSAQIAEALALPPAAVEQALDELRGCGLLDEGPLPGRGYSRREAAVRFAKAGGAAFTAPLIYSVAIASPAAAASCVINHTGCTANGVLVAGCTVTVNQTKGTDISCCSCSCYRGNIGQTTCEAPTCKVGGTTCAGNAECCSGLCLFTCLG